MSNKVIKTGAVLGILSVGAIAILWILGAISNEETGEMVKRTGGILLVGVVCAGLISYLLKKK